MQRLSVFRVFIVLMLAVFVVLAVFPAAAQNNTLSYGGSAMGTVSPQAPLAFYVFNGFANDAVTARVIGLTEGFDPILTLLAPDQTQVGSNDNDPFSPGSGDARVSSRLPADGVYTLLIGGVNGSTGDYVLVLDGRAGVLANALTPGLTALADFTTSPSPQFFNAVADPAAATVLSLTAQPATFPFAAEVRDPSGAVVATLSGLPQYALTLPAGQGSYEMIIMPANAELLGAVQLALGGADLAPVPLATVEVPNIPAPTDVCNLSTGGAVNVRTGPGTNYAVLGTLQPGNFPTVSGISADRGWYAITYNGQQGWVAGSVSTLNGPCGSLPVVQSSAAPAPTTAPGVTATIAAPVQTQEVTQPGAPTATIAAAPTAPPDAEIHNVSLDRNNGGQFSEVISYPGGDTTDRVAASVSNFDSVNTFAQFSVTMVCNGVGSEALRWGLNIQANLVCGQSAAITLTTDSNNQFFNITLPSGSPEGSYVQYTMIFTRTN
jgi:SH3-like domain-containing protein